MDIRIVHTCNNNCLYCLEQSLRTKQAYIDKQDIFDAIDVDHSDILSIYGWNPLLHPDLLEIISYGRKKWYLSINLLTNTFGLSQEKLSQLWQAWLTWINFYFNSFSSQVHDRIVNQGISLSQLTYNMRLISSSSLYFKVIIHINSQNILHLYRDVFILYTKFWVRNFEYVNYFPFDRAYDRFHDVLGYDFFWNREGIDRLFKMIIKLWARVKFSKFSRDFFWKYKEFYDFQTWILAQIWPEDRQRLDADIPDCYEETRCQSCFIKDNCKMHA